MNDRQAGVKNLDDLATERYTDFLSPPKIDGERRIVSLPPASAEFAVLFWMVSNWRPVGEWQYPVESMC